MAKKRLTLREKVEAEYKEFVSEVYPLDSAQLNMRLSNLAKGLEEVSEARKNDEELMEHRAAAQQCDAPYRDSLKELKLKTKYIIELMKERGYP